MTHPAVGPLRPYKGKTPKIADDAFVADNAIITGDVEIGSGSSVWFGVVIRGDSAPIRIGERTNIQDHTVIHADEDAPTTIGNDVTVGHRAIVHGTTLGDGAQISMGAIVLSHAIIEPGAIVGAAALVPEGMVVLANTIVMGVPAKPRRVVTEDDRRRALATAKHYVQRGKDYAEEYGNAS